MNKFSLIAAVLCVLAASQVSAHGHGAQEGGWQGSQGQRSNNMARFGGRGEDQENGGGDQGRSGWQGRNGADDSRKYRTNLFNDEEVYGYEAKYPNGEAMFVNYRNTDARARRGPDFARSNSISARNRGGSQPSEHDSNSRSAMNSHRGDSQW